MSSADKPMHTTETLPSFYRYEANAVAAPAEMRRLYSTPRSGSTFTPGSKIEHQINCGAPGMHLDPSASAYVFTIKNNSTTLDLILDGGAHSVVDQLDVLFGSQVISSTRNLARLYQLLSDFQVDPDSLKTSGSIRGVAEYDVTSQTLSETTVEAAYNRRAGVAILKAGGEATFAIPLLCCLGTLAMKAIPLSALTDAITLEIRLAPIAQWGVFPASATASPLTFPSAPVAADFIVKDCKFFHSLVKLDGRVEQALYSSLRGVISVPTLEYRSYSTQIAAGAGGISWQIPHKSSSATAIFITVRDQANVDNHATNTNTLRTKGTMKSYRFMIGSEVVPQSAVICDGNAVEARLELNRAFGVISDASARSCINGTSYASDGFCVGLNLSAFPRSESLRDGMSTRNLNLVFEASSAPTRHSASTPTCALRCSWSPSRTCSR